MLRKSSVVVVAIGLCLFLGVAISFAATRTFFPTYHKPPVWLWYLKAHLATVGVACLWWPLVHRPEVRSHIWLRITGCVVGSFCILSILAGLAALLTFGEVDRPAEVFGIYGIPMCIHAGALFYLLARPRLLLTWVLGLFLTPFLAVLIYLIVIPPELYRSEAGLLVLCIVVWLGPLLAPLLGLPFAWWWVKSAERRIAREQPVGAQRHGE